MIRSRLLPSFLLAAALVALVGGNARRAGAATPPTSPTPGLDEASFLHPPDSSRAYAWWHWMNGHISREQITRDLEAIKRGGMSGFMLWNTSEGTPRPSPLRRAFVAWRWPHLAKKSPLPSGLLGPVRLVPELEVAVP